jgi:acyl-CoA synthetase (AMP-forming)/AMP-acid ligase II
MEVYYSAVQLGAISVPLNYRLSSKDLAYIFDDSESTVLIADREFAPLLVSPLERQESKIGKVLWTGTAAHNVDIGQVGVDYEECLRRGPRREVSNDEGDEHDIAQIYYTSGTTGKPKGVVLTHKNVCTHALGAVAELQLTDNDRWIHVAPMFHLADAWATWAITWVGGTHIFVRTFDPKQVLETIVRERVTVSNLIPTMFNMLLNYDRT